jgi:hypothetical protein
MTIDFVANAHNIVPDTKILNCANNLSGVAVQLACDMASMAQSVETYLVRTGILPWLPFSVKLAKSA